MGAPEWDRVAFPGRTLNDALEFLWRFMRLLALEELQGVRLRRVLPFRP